MVTTIILIRHGETLWNMERRCQGFTDIGLSDTGEQQAMRLSESLRCRTLHAIFSSDLIRAYRTAEIISEPHRLMVRTDSRLRELNQGRCEGKKFEDLLADFPELLKDWMDDPADVEMPKGESMRQMQARGWKAIEKIADTHQGQTVAVIAHNLLNLSVICRALGLELNRFRSLRQGVTAVNELEFTPRGPVLTRLNDTHHLD